MNRELSVALLGVGAIGGSVLQGVRSGKGGRARVVAIADLPRMQQRLEALAQDHCCAWVTDPLRLADYKPDVVIEAAGQDAARHFSIPLLERGSNVLIMSVGVLMDARFLEAVKEATHRTGRRLLIPTGAIGGLDVVRAAALEGITEARLTSSKPPSSLNGAPWFEQHPTDLNAITSPTVVFSGSVAEAVQGFPQNVNVAAILSLAAAGTPVLVEIVADPTLKRNIHEVWVRGTFGEMSLRVTNVPAPDNPKTSYLACLSLLALLSRESAEISIGS